MAHEIDQSTGKPAIAYVGEEPWHGLGQKLPAGASIETLLRAARLEWELKRRPVQYLVDERVRLNLSLMASDGVEPPTPVFSGPLTELAKRSGISGCN